MRCIIGDVQKAYSPQICHRSKLAEKAQENALLGLGKNGRSSRIRHPNALTERSWAGEMPLMDLKNITDL